MKESGSAGETQREAKTLGNGCLMSCWQRDLFTRPHNGLI